MDLDHIERISDQAEMVLDVLKVEVLTNINWITNKLWLSVMVMQYALDY